MNSIYIYNSLTRKKEKFKPASNKEIKMYVCGPTVYDQPHIGHARSAYIFDIIRRYLEYSGYRVNFVRNVTDVDDKIIEKAKNEFKGQDLKTAVTEVSGKYLKAYHEAMAKLGIKPPEEGKEPKATEYIGKMIKFIELLIERGAAYEAGGDVYFDIKKANNYGKLSNQSLDKMASGVRISANENKKDPLDFALWKNAKEDEPSWDSPWGKGRPGWHIECSVMSQDLLGDEFDIHGGGIDLIFPHHENELVQSEAAGKKFVHYWIHHGLLTINGQKMAKSLGNFITVDTFIDKYKEIDLLKLLFLSTHYSHPVDFNDEKIKEAKKQKKAFDNFFDKVNFWQLKEGSSKVAASIQDKAKIDNICIKFNKAMDDDFNTAQAIASIFELIDLSSRFVSSDKQDAFYSAKAKLEVFFNIFGLKVKQKKEFPENFQLKIKEREELKAKKDFKNADELRKKIELEFNGVLIDTAGGTTFAEASI